MQLKNRAGGCIFRAFTVVAMTIVGTGCVVDCDEARVSFSFVAFCLTGFIQLWILVHNFMKLEKYPRGYWILCQISWTSNMITTIVFWGYLYHLEILNHMIRGTFIRHILMTLLHFIPIMLELREIYLRAILYQKGDYKWTVFYLIVYGAMNAIDTLLYGAPLYPMLDWREASSLVFIVIVLGMSYLVHCFGYYLSNRLHKVID